MIFNFFFLTLFLYLVVFYNFPISDEWFGTNEKMLEMVKTLVFSLNYTKRFCNIYLNIFSTCIIKTKQEQKLIHF